jgi:succinate dehydrogenase/fumarate reductase flavoprotein subunit
MSAPENTFDLCVVGAGAAGMTAALVGAKLGLSVILLEKTQTVGGTMSTSAGTVWVPGSSVAQEAGMPNTLDDAVRYLAASAPVADRSLQDTYLRTGDEAVNFLQDNTHVRFLPPARHPDYQSALPHATAGGRALTAVPFDGRRLGRHFARLRPPIKEFMVLGGMMVGKDDIPPLLAPFASYANFRHVIRLLLRHGRDRLFHPRGTRLVMGSALAGRLLLSLLEAGVTIRFGVNCSSLVTEGERVTGIECNADGVEQVIHARRGTVLATGGFSGDQSRRASLVDPQLRSYTLAAPGNTGDGLRLAERVGAQFDGEHDNRAYWMPASIMMQPDGTQSVFPHIMLDRAKPGLIAVGSDGRRFVNEADSYHDFVLAMLANAPRTSPAWLICDSDFLSSYGLGMIYPKSGRRKLKKLLKNGYLASAEKLGDLAHAIGVDATGLSESVTLHNRDSEAGVDSAFGKGSTIYNRHNGDPRRTPNPCLRPIVKAPFFALPVYPADFATSTGIATDSDGRVLNIEGVAIPGLFACGNDMASIMRGRSPGPGVTLGPALIFGYRAARFMANAAAN